MSHEQLVNECLERMRSNGFRGRRRDEHGRINNGMHTIALVSYLFDDGTTADYVEASEYHP